MTKNTRIILQASLLLGGAWLLIPSGSREPGPDGQSAESSIAPSRSARTDAAQPRFHSRVSPRVQVARELARHGLLWEESPDQRIRKRLTIPVNADAFAGHGQWKRGQEIVLPLSRTFPPLVGEVSHTGTQDDGTIVTHIAIPGNPGGLLALQENREENFFHGQLTYREHPLAYRLERHDIGMSMTRVSIEDLVCSLADHDELTVDLGLPALGAVLDAKGGGGGNGRGGKSPSVSVSDAADNEGDSGSTDLSFTVTLSKTSTSVVTVAYATADGSAKAGSDYSPVDGSLTFAAGETSKQVIVAIHGDTEEESDESFSLNLSGVSGAQMGDSSGTGTIFDDDSPPPPAPGAVPVLNSLPGAPAVAYLDMDGQTVTDTYWNSGRNRNGITVQGVNDEYSEEAMTEIWKRVVEDFAPFHINVTTDEDVYLDTPSNRRIRCIITPDYQWYGRAGGVAYLNSFTWTGDTPCWVFSSMLADTPKYIADAASHEVGHTLGLYHDGRTSPSEGYYEGHGSGVTGWAPIMGVGYYQNLVQWSKGEYLNANNLEDDLAIITGQNGFGYRADDHTGASELTSAGARGIIETRQDTDVFVITGTEGSLRIDAAGATPDTNLDILLTLYDSNGTEVARANPVEGLNASIAFQPTPGAIYHLHVTGTGKGDPADTGYSDYGSLGEYELMLNPQ